MKSSVFRMCTLQPMLFSWGIHYLTADQDFEYVFLPIDVAGATHKVDYFKLQLSLLDVRVLSNVPLLGV